MGELGTARTEEATAARERLAGAFYEYRVAMDVRNSPPLPAEAMEIIRRIIVAHDATIGLDRARELARIGADSTRDGAA